MGPVDLARSFGLGGAPRLSDGPVARGKQGLVWQLETTEGRWAVKVPLRACSEEEVRASTAFHEAAYAAGVPTPAVRRTMEGEVFAPFGDGGQARVYEWVDLLAPDPGLDPGQVGAAVAGIHQVAVTVPDEGEVDPWYRDPVGADRWDQLVEQLTRGGPPSPPGWPTCGMS